MRLLYNETATKTEMFTFQLNEGGEILLRAGGGPQNKEVIITFVNDKFNGADWRASDEIQITRNYWRVLAAIEEKIAEIEARKKQPNSTLTV